ncbi:hypothetical protein [Variovorax sp.]|uniref:hypothetical protein n=1 Tax=Variovorax sp. TaxID=1871043 RepID=UPI002D6C91A7|nr:hypothetical protein [Variovorax sp.]HYP82388.1 hypothetical protein [Variovorax sp.]
MRFARRFAPAAVVAVLLGTGIASQAMTIRELHALEANEKDGKLYANYYLVGVMEGIRQASESARRRGGKPSFCVEGRRLEPAMARGLFQGELARNADFYEADMPVELVMESALSDSFRCTR